MPENTIRRTRQLAGLVALAVIFDVIWVKAPFLVVFAVPFALAAWRLRTGRIWTRIALIAWSALYVALGVVFIVNNGIHDGAGDNPDGWINPGDFVFAYVGTPLAALLAYQLIAGWVRMRRTNPAPA